MKECGFVSTGEPDNLKEREGRTFLSPGFTMENFELNDIGQA